jgi:di/tricarboxylate transporter
LELTLSVEMMVVLGFLALTIYLFVSEVVRVDVAAVLVMVLLGVVSYAWPFLVEGGQPLVDLKELFRGFSSNAVMSIIAVMIIGAGLDKTGIMGLVAQQITRFGGVTEQRIIPMISGTVGIISSFMQNVGAAALFLPVVSRISARTGLPMSRLLMPMGFCAILGGTVTMIGSSPLILLNDLILNSNKVLGAQGMNEMKTFDLFDVTPIGLALVATGIIYFIVAGRFVLPVSKNEASGTGATMDYFRQTYGLAGEMYEATVPANSPLVGLTVEQIEQLSNHQVLLLAARSGDTLRIAPARDIVIEAGANIALLGADESVRAFALAQNINLANEMEVFAEVLTHTRAGIAEVVMPPRSHLLGRTLSDLRMRKTYGLNVLAVHRGGDTITQGFRDLTLQSGDTLVAHTRWDDLAALEKNRDFVVISSDYPHEELRPHKVKFALFFFALALSLVLFTDLRLSVALMVGAIGMIVSGVLNMDEAYQAVSWKSVFLLASLIPLGMAVELSGTAAWIAQETLRLLAGVPGWVLQAAIAVLATFFTLVMSNVGATVLLVPLAVNIAIGAGEDPRIFALTVALATSNSFFIPTHQVNALIMGPGGYRVKDFMRAGGVMTILFLIVMMVMLNLIF